MKSRASWRRADVPLAIASGVGVTVTALVVAAAQALHWELHGLSLISVPACVFATIPASERLMARIPSVFGPPEAQPMPWGFVAIAVILFGLGCLAIGVNLSRVLVLGAVAGPGPTWIGGATLGAFSVIAFGVGASALGWLALYGDVSRSAAWGLTLQRLWPLIIATTLGAAGIEGVLYH